MNKAKEWAHIICHVLETLPQDVTARREVLRSLATIAPDCVGRQYINLTAVHLDHHIKSVADAQRELFATDK